MDYESLHHSRVREGYESTKVQPDGIVKVFHEPRAW